MSGMDALALAIMVLPLATLGTFLASYKLKMILRLILVVVAFFVALVTDRPFTSTNIIGEVIANFKDRN
ncbi:MAG TPA: hypothetical protein VMJ32_09395 [Pirellulales bacterium]|nr:hypothetical protein [Pirellulales bacterium]